MEMDKDIASPNRSTTAERPRRLSQTRHARILETLATQGEVSVMDIAATLAVSDMTVRRDLLELENEGKLIRIRGGAVLPDGGTVLAMDREEPSFVARLRQQHEAKSRIAAAAAAFFSGYRTIALDVGTTTFMLAELLMDRTHVKFFTNSVRIAHRMGSSAADVYLAGGHMRGDEMAMGGPTAVAQFEALWFDIAFIGVSGITATGLFDYSFEDADIKRVYLRRSGVKVVLCDASKFQHMSLVHLGTLKEIDVLITDAEPPPALALALEAAKVQVHIAPPLSDPS